MQKKTMTCPACSSFMRTQILNDAAEKEYLIDYCTGCAGIWLDQGELQKIIEAENNVPLKILNLPPYKDGSDRIPEGARKCPRCSTLMEVKQMKGITIDMCPGCAGIWLDKSELYDLLFDTSQAKGVYAPQEINIKYYT